MSGPTLGDLLADHQPGHSALQIEAFILGRAGLTAWGRYRQALRELDVRIEQMERDEIESDRLRARHEAAQKTARGRGPKARAADLDARELDIARTALAKRVVDRYREMQHFEALAFRLRDHLDVPPGPVSAADRARLDRAEWVAQIRHGLALDILTTGAPGRAHLELLLALPVELRAATLLDLDPERRPALIAEATSRPALEEAPPC